MEDMLEDTVLVNLRINGQLHELEIPPHKSLLDLLRDELHLTGTHMGCMTGHCGACTVSIDGRVAKSCITLASTLGRAKITTIEGLTEETGELSTIQQAFWDEAGFQCAFCAPGMLMCTDELLSSNPDPSDEEIETALAGNLCRCTGYQSIRRAVKAAAAKLKEQSAQAAE